MIVLHLTWLLNLLHIARSYRYLPEQEPTFWSLGAKTGFHKYRISINDVPFHVLIVYSNLYCSGALIQSKIVLTAASCLHTRQMRRPVVKVGAEAITSMGQVIPIVDVKFHEYYKYMSRLDNDIAMVVLKEHVEFNMVGAKKVILVEPDVALRTGISIQVSGFGSTNLAQNFVNRLLWTEMLVVDKRECEEAYPNFITPSSFCGKYEPERRLSDSGGPAVFNKELLVGILSFGGTSNDEPHIAIFTNVSYFNRWIMLNTKRFLEKYCVPRTDSSGISGDSSDSDTS